LFVGQGQALAQTHHVLRYHDIGDPDIGGSALKLDPPSLLREHEIDLDRRTSARMVEELYLAADESKNSRSGGQKKGKIFSDFSFSSEVALVTGVRNSKKISSRKKRGRKIGILAWVRKFRRSLFYYRSLILL
jgi:hypothetical protein